MSKFRIYNIQLLPGDEGIEEVGVKGYKKLFAELRDKNKKHLTSKTTESFHYAMTGGNFIGPNDDFRFPAGFVYGNFVRYTKTDRLTELGSGKTIFRAGQKTAISYSKLIPFVFDTKRHFLAVDGANIPKGNLFLEILERFLDEISQEHFPNHNLEINIISEKNALEDVFKKASSYKTVDLELAFPNGSPTEKLLRQLKDTKTQLSVHASAGKSGRMSGVPDVLREMLRAAVQFGKSKITYFVKTDKGVEVRATYNSEDTPKTFEVRHSQNDSNEQAFYARVAEKLADIDVTQSDSDESTLPEAREEKKIEIHD